MLKVAVTGCAGRMGRTNVKTVFEDAESTLSGAVEWPQCPEIGQDAGTLAGVSALGVKVTSDLSEVLPVSDVVIDFTSKQAAPSIIEACVKHNTALVMGSTGLEEAEFKLIREASKSIPIIWAPNFSVGVNLINRLIREAAEVLKDDFDPEIVEVHHRMKKDSPSGTAVLLLNTLKSVYESEDVVYGREGMVGARPKDQIGVFAVRGGDVVGDHTVTFYGLGERVEISHRASSRETFSRGALRAAKYIVSHGKGLYNIDDVLGFSEGGR